MATIKLTFFTLIFSITSLIWAQNSGSLTDVGNDPAYPLEMYFVGIASSPHSQEDADNLAIGQIQKQITVNVKVNQQSRTTSQRMGNREQVNRWLDSRTNLTSQGDLQGVEITKRSTQGKNYRSMAVLKKSKFAAAKRLAMQEAGKALTTVANNALKNIEAGEIVDALNAKARMDELIRVFTEERLLLSAAESLGDDDAIPVNLDEVNKAYNDVLKKINLEVVSGDNQVLTSPGQAFEPWVLSAKVDSTALTEFPIKITAPNRKVVRTTITNDKGDAIFYPDAFALRTAGEHFYRATPDLQVPAIQVDLVERKRADFNYKMEPKECGVKLNIRGTGAVAAIQPLTVMLNNYGLKNNSNAINTLKIALSIQEKGVIQGLSEASTFTMQELVLDINILNAADASIYSTKLKAMGHGNASDAILSAIKKIELGSKASEIAMAACGDGSPSKAAPTLAIIPFNAPRTWYSDQAQATLLADMIAGQIHRVGSYQIVERTKLNEIMEEQTLGATGMIANPVEMGEILGAEYMMTGTMLGEGTSTKVEARIIEVSTGKIVKTFSITGRIEAVANLIAKQSL
ncbi:MAG: hypothetical protein GX801_00770 [Fibrobacter sp.]|nr:hypothetical protein [Fibrobacter sp.]